MFNNAHKQLLAIKTHFAKCDARETRALIVEAQLTTQLEELTSFFKEHSLREDGRLKEMMHKDDQLYKENLTVLEKIKDDIQGIKVDLASQPKDVAFLLLKQQEDINRHSDNTFATKTEVTGGLGSIRKQAKFAWSIVLLGIIAFGWVVDKLIQLKPLIVG